MIYLASPYSHSDKGVMAQRANEVAATAARLMSDGHILYCPIAAWHWVGENHDLPKDWPSWRKLDISFLRHCHQLWVCTIPGWLESVGVTEEIAFARTIDIPVSLIHPNATVLKPFPVAAEEIMRQQAVA